MGEQRAKALRRVFTLSEILVIAGAIALLAGLAIRDLSLGCLASSREITLRHDLRVLRDLILQYRVDCGFFPDSLDTLVEEGNLRSVPLDPATGNADWIELRLADGTIHDVRSSSTGVDRDGIPHAAY